MFASVGHFAVAKFSFAKKKYESLPYSITALHVVVSVAVAHFAAAK
jgi:hypothetical protein